MLNQYQGTIKSQRQFITSDSFNALQGTPAITSQRVPTCTDRHNDQDQDQIWTIMLGERGQLDLLLNVAKVTQLTIKILGCG